jgi:hypothetical protein
MLNVLTLSLTCIGLAGVSSKDLSVVFVFLLTRLTGSFLVLVFVLVTTGVSVDIDKDVFAVSFTLAFTLATTGADDFLGMII